jgi:ribose/xylose/arabinose/galactoside ABC-type transport system permease subunit
MERKKKITEGKRRRLNQSLVLAMMIVGLCIIATIVNPRFIRVTNLINILQQISVLGIIASGVGMLLIAGEIDISVGSMVSLMGIVLAMILEKSGAIPPDAPNAWMTNWAVPLTILATFIIGALCGFINGITVIKSRAASFIITLGFGSVYKGIALLVSGGASFSLYGRFEALGRGRILDYLPISILFLFGIVVLTHVLLKYSKYGRFLYAIGGNRKAAFVSGINTTRVTLRGFIMVGVFNALAALILISRTGTALATTAEAYSLDALASVVVGGVAITGGKGNALSIFLGVLLIGLVSNALVIMNVNPYMRGVAIGLIIIIAVSVSGLSEQRK